MFFSQTSLSTAITTAVFVIIFILIGVPVWWKTTEVYRYPIPHEACQNLVNLKMTHVVPVRLMIADSSVDQSLLWENLSALDEQNPPELTVELRWSMSFVSNEEDAVIKYYKNISDVDSAFNILDENPHTQHLRKYELDGEIIILVMRPDMFNGSKFTIGKYKMGFILNDDPPNLAQDVLSLIKKMGQIRRLQKLYVAPSTHTGDMKPDKERMRNLRSATNFDITFSLFIPEPHLIHVEWNIEEAINAYLEPILKQISLIYNVNVKSQFLYMTPLPLPSMNNNENGEYILHSDTLASIINPAEARLGSDTSVFPNLNFVIYIPTREQTPLRIYDAEGNPITTNAFLLPQWGGFLFYNVPIPKDAQSQFGVHLDETTFMEVFLTQLRLLLGLPYLEDLVDAKTEVFTGPSLSRWEINFLLRKNTQDHLATAASSLSSLSNLLGSISNIVIREDVGKKIHKAVRKAHRSMQLMSGSYIEDAFRKAKAAFLASEEAFFDPSLLALLYFPEDQKYAIYIPLFLPISIPVIASCGRLWKYWKDRKTKPKTD